jgi:type IX secretion system PorP/SprF family membrane protein
MKSNKLFKAMNLKYIFLVSFIGVFYSITWAQQDAQYTQYMYNTISVNPAYAGSRGVLSLTALHRAQWIGLDGAPRSQTFNIHAPTGKNVGLGFNVVNDELGPVQETSFDLAFSYSVPTSDTGKLSFGLKAGGHLLNIDFLGLSQYDVELDATDNIDRKFSPNFGTGIYYHDTKFYLGASVPNMLQTRHFDESVNNDNSNGLLARERLNYYFMGGYILDLSDNLKFKPAFLGKMVNGAPLQIDVSANFLFADKLSLGLAYRWNSAWSTLASFQLSRGIMLGIAYDAETTALGRQAFNSGSFEAILRFEIFNTNNGLLYPRFF